MHWQKNKQANQKWTETFQNVTRPLGPQIYMIGKQALNDRSLLIFIMRLPFAGNRTFVKIADDFSLLKSNF